MILAVTEAELSELYEIRLRTNKPLELKIGQKCVFPKGGGTVTKTDIESVISAASDHSLNSVKNEIASGFIPLKYGCRAGVAGECIVKNGEIEFQKDISSVNIRIAREKKGLASRVINDIVKDGRITSTLIVSPPGCGKTTMLRDVARVLAEEHDVAVIDERGEIASVFSGEPQFDLGKRSDVFSSCPKAKGIVLAVRSLSPEVIITDEISLIPDAEALADAKASGVSFVATLHGNDIDSALVRSQTKVLTSSGALEKVILLSDKPVMATVKEVRDIK